jgi:Asp-tRNA(Asn)/Glu-tRNA(Gln) amidotransferase A subunit family amidase
MCLGALASQTGGSITRPASFCGVCSIKPTYGRVSVDGVLPLAPSMDHVGAMANCVRDLAILFQTIAGHDPRDPGSSRHPVSDAAPQIEEILADSQPPIFWRMKAWSEEQAEPVMRDALDGLGRSVHALWLATPPDWSDVVRYNGLIMAVQAAAYHGPRLKRHPDDYPPRVRELIETGLRTPSTEYDAALDGQRRAEDTLHPQFGPDDAIMGPAAVGPAPPADTTGNPVFNAPWSLLGFPTVSLPFAWADGLPLGVQLAGKRNREHALLAAAAWLERAIGFERRAIPL